MAGIYIHIPFCRKACHYCNFHFSTSRKGENDFSVALLNEIELQANYLEKQPVETIYFGGGTPSMMSSSFLKEVLKKIAHNYSVSKTAEITLEANPDDITDEHLQQWKSIGINRLSIGIQSFFEEDLQWMNRAHNSKQALKALESARQLFDNITVDLIYGTPGLTDEMWKQNVDTVLGLQIPHLSCYALTVEPKTALHHMVVKKEKSAVNSEDQARQFLLLMDWMEKAGFDHYEISNFALPGMRSRHNSAYWSGAYYLGLGPSAHSFNGKSRQWNIANNALYSQSLLKNELLFEIETLTPVQQLNEYIMTALRTMEGISMATVEKRFGEAAAIELKKGFIPFEKEKKLLSSADRYFLSKEGRLLADGIAASLFFDEP
ncbi:MAG: radical SAM family heme chaperone HemW [Chitinophagaceae bacterium]|nr:radical SAM family heme chaperone HemW [Chitinophagaceae bacterium]